MRKLFRFGLLAAAAMLISNCASGADQPSAATGSSPAGLEGTSWRLVEIRSMADAKGAIVPPNPDNYTMRLESGARAIFLLDCNRGRGNWTSAVAGDGSGSISFGPIATTRMACPPPSLGDRLANDLARVRAYRVIDGRLSLSLMADGGILIWEQTAATAPP